MMKGYLNEDIGRVTNKSVDAMAKRVLSNQTDIISTMRQKANICKVHNKYMRRALSHACDYAVVLAQRKVTKMVRALNLTPWTERNIT